MRGGDNIGGVVPIGSPRAASGDKLGAPGTSASPPNGWFQARDVIEGQSVKVYVSGFTKPSLTVTALSEPRGGTVALHTGDGSAGDYANVKVTPKRKPAKYKSALTKSRSK